MRCPFCNIGDSKVIDSRSAEDGITIRRRRECSSCNKRFTTYEVVEQLPLMVIKKDGRRVPFEREKLLSGIVKACEKRPVSIGSINMLATNIEKDLKNTMDREIPSQDIGETVMKYLKDFDQVAYVRFASVYRQFTDVGNFMKELETLMKSNNLKGDG